MAKTALVIIDMLNTYEHDDADRLTPSVARALPAVVNLLEQARDRRIPVIYANDNFGKWRSHLGEILEAALAGPHADLVEPVRPDEDSYFIVKARHSVFYETPLAYLLRTLDVDHLVLCGQVTEQCVLYSALDAHIRRLSITVARDAVAHIHEDLADAALRMMEVNMSARVVPAADALR
ncbi:cysteine hydrolase [Streptomyces sp. ISL-43]|uniref:isochorismatase family cysteine hydrolase n=1 Tax=Streptomyces sp. ISL-43 TaxID=2819183 RepID=UPI001BE8DFF6|nr:isochorismatase family cysteine hydrolase [Streptomyces sp. ISL-43]MBT2452349.1 cysteine hydrolase [Streptomyces sp. ISL-43]